MNLKEFIDVESHLLVKTLYFVHFEIFKVVLFTSLVGYFMMQL